MATPSARLPERGYHQDYIARIRYENTLPPPPGAPKLLNIPTEGLKYYTSANFSSRLARQQPLNIEADAELGMPIDLVGMPGIFDGDESCKFYSAQYHNTALNLTCFIQLYKRHSLRLPFIPRTKTSCVLSQSLESPYLMLAATVFSAEQNTFLPRLRHEQKQMLMLLERISNLLL